MISTVSNANQIRWGIIGTGRIAHAFANALSGCEGAVTYAVASRTGQKADDFAKKFGFQKSYGSYAELARDPNVDVVYIATPMSAHYHDAKLCLDNRKNVLCEKSVTLNVSQLEELLGIAQKNDLFFMEAMWMKCCPVYCKAMEWAQSHRIGEICHIKASFCNLVPYNGDDRLFRADCGGGALLDLAVYPLTLVYDLLGIPEHIETHAHIRNGIDLSNTILLQSENAFAFVDSGFEYSSRNNAAISGSDGIILFDDNFHHTNEVHLYNRAGKLIETYTAEDRINGYEYEIQEVMYCLRNRLPESRIVQCESTIAVMRMMDECRRQWNMKFPEEK